MLSARRRRRRRRRVLLLLHGQATGTAANMLALATVAPPYGVVYSPAGSHAASDECNAPESAMSGAKFIAVPSPDGKVDPASVAGRDDHKQPRGIGEVLSFPPHYHLNHQRHRGRDGILCCRDSGYRSSIKEAWSGPALGRRTLRQCRRCRWLQPCRADMEGWR